jgi:hypothetical protein
MAWASRRTQKRSRNNIRLRLAAAALGFILGAMPSLALGQSSGDPAAAMPPATVEDALQQMSAAAGVIFTGQVTAIRRIPGEGGASGTVEIDFLVNNAVRGCVAGQTYTLREWAGLWVDSSGRYRVGQRLLMMLRSPGPSGISSPVGGMDGAVPIRGVESQITPDNSSPAITTGATVNAASVTPASSPSTTTPSAPVDMVDLRWIGARTLRTATTSATTISGTTVNGTGSASSGNSSVPAQGASMDTVLGMLGSWEQARAAH